MWVLDDIFYVTIILALTFQATSIAAIDDEFMINQNTEFTGSPKITSINNGNAFVIWDGGNIGIYGRIFNSNGTAISDEFTVFALQNTSASSYSKSPAISASNNGNVLISWLISHSYNNISIYGQIFNATGSSVTNKLIISQHSLDRLPELSMASLSNSNTFVTWNGGHLADADVYGRIIDNNGIPTVNEFQIPWYTFSDQDYPAITTLSNGNVFVIWRGVKQDRTSIYGRIFNSVGTSVSDEFTVPQNTLLSKHSPIITSFNNGKVLIVWVTVSRPGHNDIYGRIFNSDGLAYSNEFIIPQNITSSQNSPAIALMSNDNVFIAWQLDGIYGRIFNSNGTAASNDFRISQHPIDYRSLTVAALSNGNIFVTWHGEQANIYGQVLTSDYINSLPLLTFNTSSIITSNIYTSSIITSSSVTSNSITSGRSTTGKLTTGGQRTVSSSNKSFSFDVMIYIVISINFFLLM